MEVAQPSASKSKTLIASDGLEYEDITQRLLGNSAPTYRNLAILEVRFNYPENEVQGFITAYDKARGTHSDKYQAGWRAISRVRRASHWDARSASNREDFGVIDTRVRPQSC